jgi:hypothetical protein
MTEISVNVGDVMPGEQGFRKSVKISCDQWELNVWLTDADIEAIKTLRPVRWADRKSMRIGTCARSPVFWCLDDAELSILIGDDDGTWDVAFKLPDTVLAEMLAGF